MSHKHEERIMAVAVGSAGVALASLFVSVGAVLGTEYGDTAIIICGGIGLVATLNGAYMLWLDQ